MVSDLSWIYVVMVLAFNFGLHLVCALFVYYPTYSSFFKINFGKSYFRCHSHFYILCCLIFVVQCCSQ